MSSRLFSISFLTVVPEGSAASRFAPRSRKSFKIFVSPFSVFFDLRNMCKTL